jgi:hypothetical protein
VNKVKIKMRQTAAGPDGPFMEGGTYDVRPELASQYVNAGAAEFVGRAPEQAVQPTGESREEAPEWPLKMAPDRYIALNADSENPDVQARVALARRIVEAG